jgi:peptidoglycan/LPS O-acetylase OafA/YrhL
MTKLKKEYLHEFDALRGLFALLIVIFHFPNNSALYDNSFIKNSFQVVDCFFVISGFVIAYNYEKKLNNFNQFKLFIKKRFYRLYPLHIIFLILFAIVEFFKNYSLEYFNVLPNNQTNNLIEFFKNVILIHGFNSYSFNEPSWSISVEFYTYVIFAFYCIYLKEKKYLFLIVILGLYLVEFKLFNTSFQQLGRCLFGFFCGYFIFKIHNKFKVTSSNYFSIFLFILVLFLISLNLKYKFFIIPLIFSVFIITLLKDKKNSLLKNILNSNILKYLGKISYSIYITHYIIAYTFRQVLHFLFKFDLENNYLVLNNYFLIIMTIYMITVISVSILTHLLIENKFRLK